MTFLAVPAALTLRASSIPPGSAEMDPLHGRSAARPDGPGPSARKRGPVATVGSMLPRVRINETRTRNPDDFPGRVVTVSAFGISAGVALYTRRDGAMEPSSDVREAGGFAGGEAIGHDMHVQIANPHTGAIVWEKTRRRVGGIRSFINDPRLRRDDASTSSVGEPGQV